MVFSGDATAARSSAAAHHRDGGAHQGADEFRRPNQLATENPQSPKVQVLAVVLIECQLFIIFGFLFQSWLQTWRGAASHGDRAVREQQEAGGRDQCSSAAVSDVTARCQLLVRRSVFSVQGRNCADDNA